LTEIREEEAIWTKNTGACRRTLKKKSMDYRSVCTRNGNAVPKASAETVYNTVKTGQIGKVVHNRFGNGPICQMRIQETEETRLARG
jgi:hypothetical protein